MGSDVADLLPHLEDRCARAIDVAIAKLAARATAESADMRTLLEDQAKRIQATQKKWNQLALAFDPAEMDQLRANMRHWEARLAKLSTLIDSEPQRIADAYVVKARRVEPVGIAYLWPVTG